MSSEVKPNLGDLTAELMDLDDLSSSEIIRFGVLLGMELAAVEKISREVEESIRLLKLLDSWLQINNDASYKKIVKALRAIKRNVLADEIEKNHCGVSGDGGAMAATADTVATGNSLTTTATNMNQLLPVLHEELLPAQNTAHFLALKLGITHYTVEGLKKQYSNPGEFLLAILSEFLNQQIDINEVWPKIVSALKSPSIRLIQLANKIEAAHCSSTPPTPSRSSSSASSGVGSDGGGLVTPSSPPTGPLATSLPTLPLLMKYPKREGGFANILQYIAGDYRTFCTLLLNDDTGVIVDSTHQSSIGRPDATVHTVCSKWLQGCGREPRSWITLADVLDDANLSQPASIIRNNLT